MPVVRLCGIITRSTEVQPPVFFLNLSHNKRARHFDSCYGTGDFLPDDISIQWLVRVGLVLNYIYLSDQSFVRPFDQKHFTSDGKKTSVLFSLIYFSYSSVQLRKLEVFKFSMLQDKKISLRKSNE